MKTNSIIINNIKKDQQFIVVDNEKKTFVIILTGEKDQVGDVKIIINGKKTEVQILGIIIGQGKQKINLYTLQDHLKPESKSDLLIKSVLFDEAKFYYQGLIKIEKDAQKSNAYQKNQNILMSPKSWADSRPTLEILANDVRCTHGATVGKIDQEQIYYLTSRGLSEKIAQKMLLEGFLNEIILRIPDEKLQDEIRVKIKNKISQLLN
ncbi:hypothetical protein A3D03_04825 [Candidatus Gottesmanbacteria bacterium RIFCSPHIGHO2_02_FULL_40_13]|uniref:SUF system FeS cluster assembly SufBD core domain-containing protein n=1 Tax=Candidatus Gottesmanbacteria bacterium RIFCSPHIGHO2_02_FULL_40_13 TaxID=1798384 RepID=A0A1F6A9S1_9BACT|nr:MAG: hypothetical protein A3D03_04825 [Candidatus Gottesmanbacteria bacterium RIFCSPHIGHO2_02_FULL_40_13]